MTEFRRCERLFRTRPVPFLGGLCGHGRVPEEGHSFISQKNTEGLHDFGRGSLTRERSLEHMERLCGHGGVSRRAAVCVHSDALHTLQARTVAFKISAPLRTHAITTTASRMYPERLPSFQQKL